MADPPQPGNVTVIYASGNDIQCQYSYTPLPSNPTSFQFVWGTVNNPLDAGNTTVNGDTAPLMTIQQEFTVTSGTLIYIWGKISYKSGGSGKVNYSPLPYIFQTGDSNQPGTPYVTAVAGNGDITLNFQSNKLSTTNLLVVYGTDPNPAANQNFQSVSLVTSPDIWGTTSFAVPQGVDVYIWSRAVTFADGTFYSNPPLIYNSTVPPVDNAPGTPELVAEDLTKNQITVNFQTTPVPGEEQVFALVYNTVNNPTAPGGSTNTAFNVNGDTWGSGPFTVKPNVNIYIWASSTFNGQTLYSVKPLIYNTDTTGIPPSGPSSTPVVFQATNTSISVTFNTAGITGTAPISVLCNASKSALGPFNLTCAVTGTAPSYTAIVNGLQSNTTYYFQTVVYNATLPNQPSAVSAGIQTLSTNQVDPPFYTSALATQITMRFTLPANRFTSSVGNLYWGNREPPVNKVPASYLGIIQGVPTWEATVYNLTPGTTYYFQGAVTGSTNSINTPVTTDRGNSFDLGYMPPRPWAFATYVNGVSQPWRQT